MTKYDEPLSCCIVGSGTRFLSGISYYTIRLANALVNCHPISVILMRNLLPVYFYPGRSRVGEKLTEQNFLPGIKVFDGVDWFWIPSIFRALIFLWREKPDVVIFQWWTGTVLHSYLTLAWFAQIFGAKIVIEFHEVLDTGEARIGFVQKYVNLFFPWLVRFSSGYVFHSEYDRDVLENHYSLNMRPFAIIHHGPYDQYQTGYDQTIYRSASQHSFNLLYFGVIRPFKGLEDLITAFNTLTQAEVENYWLTIVGEIWEGWQLPAELIEKSPYRARITFIDRYVPDGEVAAIFAGADAVVLPYHRSSASGPLHIAMSYGLPVVVTNVGGLTEAVKHYEGAILVPPKDPTALQNAIRKASALRGTRFSDPHSWDRNIRLYSNLFSDVVRSRDGNA